MSRTSARPEALGSTSWSTNNPAVRGLDVLPIQHQYLLFGDSCAEVCRATRTREFRYVIDSTVALNVRACRTFHRLLRIGRRDLRLGLGRASDSCWQKEKVMPVGRWR